MNKFKKVLSLVLGVSFLLGSFSHTYAATTTCKDTLITSHKAIANITFQITPTIATHSASSDKIMVQTQTIEASLQQNKNGTIVTQPFKASVSATSKTLSKTIKAKSVSGLKFVDKAYCTFFVRLQEENSSVSKKLSLFVN